MIQNDVVIHGDLVRPATSSSHNRTASTAGDPKASSDPSSQQPQNQTSIHLGRHVYISPGVVLHPPSRLQTISSSSSTTAPQQVTTYYPLSVASHVFIGANSVIRAAEIKSNVWIGANVVVGNMVIIKEDVKILDGSVLPQGSVWCSGSVVGGRPARVVGSVGEGWGWGSDAVGGASGKNAATGGATGSAGEVEGSVGARVRERWALVGSAARKA